MDNDKNYPVGYDGTSFGIDLNSQNLQQMAKSSVSHANLQEVVYDWLRGTTMFFSLTDMAGLTYRDFVLHIGCDAQEYRFDNRGGYRAYTWCATDKEGAKFTAFFKQNENGEWTISASGSVQISMPDDYLDKLKGING